MSLLSLYSIIINLLNFSFCFYDACKNSLLDVHENGIVEKRLNEIIVRAIISFAFLLLKMLFFMFLLVC